MKANQKRISLLFSQGLHQVELGSQTCLFLTAKNHNSFKIPPNVLFELLQEKLKALEQNWH